MSQVAPPKSEGEKGLNALIWQYLGTFGRAIATFLFGVLLARLLGPEPFATVAIAQSFVGLASLLADFGMTTALIQREQLEEQTISFVFTLQLLIAILLSLIFGAASPALAHNFNLDAWQPLAAISLVFLLQGLGQSSAALLKRNLRFKELNIVQLAAYVLGYGVIGLLMALQGAGVWALVIAQLSQALLASFGYIWLIRPPLCLTLKTPDTQLLRFSGAAALSNVVSWGISNLPTLMIGKLFGATSLALYNRAAMTAGVPLTNIVSVMQTVLLSLYSRNQDKPKKLSQLYVGSLSVVGGVLFPAFGILAVLAWPLTSFLFGPKWEGIEPLMAFLLLVMPFDAVAAITSPLLIGVGSPRRDLLGQLLTLVISGLLVGTIIIFFRPTLFQLVAAIAVCVYIIRAMVLLIQANQVVRLGTRQLANPALFCLTGTAIACLMTYIGHRMTVATSPLIQLAVGGLLGALGLLAFLLSTRNLWGHNEGVWLLLEPLSRKLPVLRRLIGRNGS